MTTQTVSMRPHGARVIGPFETTDAYCRDLGTAGRASRTVRDAVLEAVATGHLLRLGKAWEGELQPRLDLAAIEIAKLVTPLSDPTGRRKLTAEPAPGELDLGLVFDGLEAIRKAEEASNAEMRDTLRRQGVEMLERAMRDAKQRSAKSGTTDWAESFFARSRASQDAARSALARGEAEIAERRLGGNRTADASPVTPPKGPRTIEEINRANAEFWARQGSR